MAKSDSESQWCLRQEQCKNVCYAPRRLEIVMVIVTVTKVYIPSRIFIKCEDNEMAETMPVIFLGHSNPMNALQINAYTKAWATIGTEIPRPKAVLSISAHWYIARTALTAMPAPRTIHDFGGFPQELNEVKYPAPGDPALANRFRALLSSTP